MMKIHFKEQGSRSDPPLIFLHAFPLTHTMWEDQIHTFASDFYCIAYDMRGFGKSPVGDGQYTIDLYVDDLFQLMDELHLSKTIICGLSMGGYIALRAMERNPERVQGLVLCDTKSEADTNDAKIKRAETMKAIKKEGVSSFAETFLHTALSSQTFNSNPELVIKLTHLITQNSPLGICGALLALAGRTDTSAVLPRIHIPTLILVGENDSITPPALAQQMAQKISGAQLEIIPRAGHLSNVENPQDFNESLRRFLEEVCQ